MFRKISLAVVAILSAVCLSCERKGEAPGSLAPATIPPKAGAVRIEYEVRPSILIYAASGEIHAPMQVYEDPAAAGGKYVLAPEGPNHQELSKGGDVTFRLSVPAAGAYSLWFRTHWCCDCGNSLDVVLDGADMGTVEDAVLQKWHWVPLRRAATRLTAGEHLLVVKNREDGSSIDQVLFTQDSDYRPAGVEAPDVKNRTVLPAATPTEKPGTQPAK